MYSKTLSWEKMSYEYYVNLLPFLFSMILWRVVMLILNVSAICSVGLLSVLWDSSAMIWMYHLSVEGHVSWFQLRVITYKQKGFCVTLKACFLGYLAILTFSEWLYSFIHPHIHNTCVIQVLLHFLQYLELSPFCVFTILLDVWRYLTLVLIFYPTKPVLS